MINEEQIGWMTRPVTNSYETYSKGFYSRNDGGEGAEETRSLEGIFMCSFTPHLKDRYATFTYTTHG